MKNKIYWLTGHSGVGKTTIAKALQSKRQFVMLDGDEMRDSISLGAGFTPEARREHNLRVARLANVLSEQTMVIVTVIAPQKSVREEIAKICDPEFIWVKRTMPDREGHWYEEPEGVFTLDHDVMGIEESVAALDNYIGCPSDANTSLFIGRYQPLHDGHLALFQVALDEGKKVVIALRDTPICENNPYTPEERITMVKDKIPEAEVIVIPDISEVCIGRGVGYKIRQISLPKDVESISATKIRAADMLLPDPPYSQMRGGR
jgi:adenylylsulfate kinase